MTTTPQSDALHAALEARRRSEATDYPDGTPLPTTPVLHALAQWIAQEIPATVNDATRARLRTLERLATDAALYGYPRPALEQLGAQAAHLPAARSTDPHTAHDAATEVSGRPSTRNQLGRLLVAFRVRARAFDEATLVDGDEAMTSEEAAHRAGISPTSEYAKRCSDLTLLGYIRVAQDADGHDRTRKGRSGMQRLVFELTEDGRRLADDLIVRRG